MRNKKDTLRGAKSEEDFFRGQIICTLYLVQFGLDFNTYVIRAFEPFCPYSHKKTFPIISHVYNKFSGNRQR